MVGTVSGGGEASVTDPNPVCFTRTFLQKPEKRTWLDWSLFFSSLETWRKAELVRGESLACKNQRTKLSVTERGVL